MARKILAIGLYILCASSAFNSNDVKAKNQGHGLVTMGGEIVETPCGIDNDSLDQTVDFGLSKIKDNQRGKDEGLAGSRREFVIHLTNCDLASTVEPGYVNHKVNVTFNGLADSHDSSLLGVNGEAKGVAIQLQNENGSQIRLGEPSADYELLNGNNTLHLRALLKIQIDKVQAGEFHTLAQFVVSYL